MPSAPSYDPSMPAVASVGHALSGFDCSRPALTAS
jgi:hypothetical protein